MWIAVLFSLCVVCPCLCSVLPSVLIGVGTSIQMDFLNETFFQRNLVQKLQTRLHLGTSCFVLLKPPQVTIGACDVPSATCLRLVGADDSDGRVTIEAWCVGVDEPFQFYMQVVDRPPLCFNQTILYKAGRSAYLAFRLSARDPDSGDTASFSLRRKTVQSLKGRLEYCPRNEACSDVTDPDAEFRMWSQQFHYWPSLEAADGDVDVLTFAALDNSFLSCNGTVEFKAAGVEVPVFESTPRLVVGTGSKVLIRIGVENAYDSPSGLFSVGVTRIPACVELYAPSLQVLDRVRSNITVDPSRLNFDVKLNATSDLTPFIVRKAAYVIVRGGSALCDSTLEFNAFFTQTYRAILPRQVLVVGCAPIYQGSNSVLYSYLSHTVGAGFLELRTTQVVFFLPDSRMVDMGSVLFGDVLRVPLDGKAVYFPALGKMCSVSPGPRP